MASFNSLATILSQKPLDGNNYDLCVTPHSRGSVDYPSTRGIQVDVGVPDATSENQVESHLYEELYPNKIPACYLSQAVQYNHNMSKTATWAQ